MPSLSEIAGALYGAYRLARLDAQGMRLFDLSIAGFWRSFFAAILMAPFFALLVYLQGGEDYFADAAIVEFAGYFLGWAAFPLAMVAFAHAFDLGRNYIAFMVAYNWSQLVVMVVLLPVTAIVVLLPIPGALAGLALLAVMMAALAYLWFIARTALAISPPLAAAVVALEFALTYLIRVGVAALAQ